MQQVPTATVGDVDALIDPFLLDVREDDEFAAGHAPDAEHRPLGTLPDACASLPRDQTIVVICRSGNRSAHATAFLVEQGFDAVNLAGGMQAWAAVGFEVVSATGDAGTVI